MGRSRPGQLALPLGKTWGGARVGAGRKPGFGRRCVPHRVRPTHRENEPVHITLRSAFRPLRSQFVFPTVRGAIAASNRGDNPQFRVVHFSVQADHLHLIVEADSRSALLRGIRGLAVRIAKRVNRLVSRHGRLWADRWHGRARTSPRAVRNALVYVLGNFRKHESYAAAPLDPFSSAPYFPGFREFPNALPVVLEPRLIPPALAPPDSPPVATPTRWLLSVGWRRRGLLSVHECPRAWQLDFRRNQSAIDRSAR
jgi:putative transposase